MLDNKKKIKNNRSNNKQVFGTYEWANCNANFINGCKHDCKYCYSKEMAIRFNRKTPDTWKIEEVRHHILNKKFSKHSGTIMFPSSHDIHPDHLKETIIFLKKVLTAGNKILIVSKPHFECIKTICDTFPEFKSNVLFRFTIGSCDSEILKFWEPNAPNFPERLASLVFAHTEGFQTSVSCEPMLDDHVDMIFQKVLPFVTDAVWVGKANYLLKRLRINGASDNETITRANELLEWQSDEKILKLYNRFKNDPKIKWKESIKKVVGLEISTKNGLDI